MQIHRENSDIVLECFADGYFDWIDIGGNHLYEYVARDLQLSFEKTRTGGLITGDDYVEVGWWKGGVKKAVDEFKRHPRVRLIAIDNCQLAFKKP